MKTADPASVLRPLALVCALAAGLLATAPHRLSAQRVERDVGGIFPPGATVQRIFDDGFFTEGPAMGPDGLLYFSDITFTDQSGMQPGYIWRVDPASGRAEIWRSPSGMSNGLAWDGQGRLLAALGADFGGRAIVRTDPSTGRGVILAGLYDGRRLNSPNDLVLDAGGRVFFTDPRYAGHEPVEQPVAGVYRIDPDGTVVRIIDDAGKPNGIVVSPDGRTLYVASIEDPFPTGSNTLRAWDLAGDGSVSNPRTLIDFRPDAGPDGMAVDVDGNLYLARPAAEPGIYVVSPRGEELAYLRLPEGPSNVAFGTREHARTIFITAGPNVYAVNTARVGHHAQRSVPAPATGSVLESSLETIDIASSQRRVVHRVRDHIEAPNWSPDGGYLLYNSNGRIYTIPVEGGKPELLDTGFATRVNNDHGISPDGTQLVISDQSRDGGSRIYVLPIGGGTPRLVTPRAPSYWHGWSPDGRTLAYVGERDGEFDIYTIPVEGGDETRLTTARGLDDGPDYSPDGEHIYFNSVRTGTMQIWRMRPDGSDQEQVTFDAYNDWFPHPSPDGRWVAFLSYQPGVEGHPANHDVMLRIMPAGGGEPRVLARLFGGQGTINVPSWSPDSRSLAFVSYRLVP